MKMTVVYVKNTGQVMAAFTRAALTDAPPAIKDGASPEVLAMVGEALPVRGFRTLPNNVLSATRFSIPADHLVTLTVDRDEDQLLSPRGFSVLDGKTLEPAATPIAADFPSVTVAPSDPSTLVIDLHAAPLVELPISLHLVPRQGEADASQHFQGVFKPAPTPVHVLRFTARAPLSGTYDVLMLLKGYRTVIRTVP